MKVFIMTDLEGPSGVNGRSDGIGNKIINETTAKELLLEEVNAVIEGLVRGGATEIIAWDGHGGSNSLDITKLHEAASLGTLGGDMAPINLLDSSFDAAIQIGSHSYQGTAKGYLNHSFNSHSIVNMYLNGIRIGEIGIITLMASYFGVPTILIAGDTTACLEAKEFIGENNVVTVETKKSISRYSVVNFNPTKVREELSAKAQEAIKQVTKMKIKRLKGPYEYKIQFMCPNMADNYEKIGAERVDHYTIMLRSNDFIDLIAQRAGWAAGIHNKRFFEKNMDKMPSQVYMDEC
jgi:D-amino peptidase